MPLPSKLWTCLCLVILSGCGKPDLRSRADAGNPDAQFEMGMRHLRGNGGLSKDITEAMRYLRMAAGQGDAHHEFMLGSILSSGKEVPKDEAEAAKWFRKAADHGDRGAQFALGNFFALGQGGLPQDHFAAARWWHISAERGLQGAQQNLGRAYRDGFGVPKDEVEAFTWWLIADAKGESSSAVERDELEKSLSPEQKARARIKADERRKEIEARKWPEEKDDE